jgi:hypothetical protein
MRATNEPIEKKVETNKQPVRPLCIVVLGMHRSGTSVLTGVLGLLGASLPKKLMPANGTNPKGFFEPKDIVELHDEMLSALGSSWADYRRLEPARFNSTAAAPFKARLVAALRAEYDNATMFVVKDPRICRFFPLWSDTANIFGAETRALLVIRNPLEVAWSLAQRDGLPHGYGLKLWLRYVLDSEFDTRHSPRTFVTYDDLMRDWMRVIEKSENELGIALSTSRPETRTAVDAFIDRDMRHHAVDEEAFALEYGDNPLVLKTYRALKTLAARRNDADAMKALDEVRETFDETIRARGYQVDGDLISVLNKLHLTQGRIAQFENQASLVGPLQNELASAQARISELEMKLAERTKEMDRLDRRLLFVQKNLAKIAALGVFGKVDQERRGNLELELHLMTSSLSWRLGKPLRVLAAKFPGCLRVTKRLFGM